MPPELAAQQGTFFVALTPWVVALAVLMVLADWWAKRNGWQ
jgi:hypothetical protein